MEMSMNRPSLPWRCPAVPLPRLLLLAVLWVPMFLPDLVAPAMDCANGNSTLLFDGGGVASALGSSLRNCSCPALVQDCNEALANLLCSCRTIPRSALPPGGLRGDYSQTGPLVVWMWRPWVLQELLNGSQLTELRLSYCGAAPLISQLLTVFGLRRLHLHNPALGVSYPDQELNIASSGGGKQDSAGDGSDLSLPQDSSSSVLQVVVLDVAVLNGLWALRAYSVAGSTISTLAQHFPNLPLPPPPLTIQDPQDTLPSDPQQDCILTFVY